MDTKTLIKGVIGLSKAALHIDRADPSLVECRRELCNSCQHRKVVFTEVCGQEMNVAKCTICKCYIQAKVLILGEKCPINIW